MRQLAPQNVNYNVHVQYHLSSPLMTIIYVAEAGKASYAVCYCYFVLLAAIGVPCSILTLSRQV
jgi:hypothetical protein